MSPRAADLLLEAVDRTPVPEDRLTELLAHALAMDDDLRARFCKLCSVPGLVNADIRTQRRLSTTRRVDLELLLREGPARHATWIEIKAGAPEQKDQLHDYAVELDRLYGDQGTLVALAPTGDSIFEQARSTEAFGRPLAQSVTWQQVENEVNATGGERDGRGWRQTAGRAQATARQRTLLEVHSYLQRRKETLAIMPDDPLQVTDTLALSRVRPLRHQGGLIDTILDLAAGHVDGCSVDPWNYKDWRGRAFRGLEAPRWTHEAVEKTNGEVGLELWYSWTDAGDRHDEPRHQPIFLASLTLNRPTEECFVAMADPQWDLPEWAFPYAERHYRRARISAIRYVAEVATEGITLSGQAEALGQWASRRLKTLQALSAPPRFGG